MPNSQVGQRITDGIRHRRGHADRTKLTGALGAQGCVWGRGYHAGNVEVGQLRRPRQRILRQVGGQQLAFAGVHGLLEKGLAQAVRNSTMHLAVEDLRIADRAGVMHAEDVRHLNLPGLLVNFHLGHLRAIGEVEAGGIEERCNFQAWLHARRHVPTVPQRQRNFLQGLFFVRAAVWIGLAALVNDL